MSSTASRVSHIQYAALPWRETEGTIEILLVTTRNTGRWIVPKGWPVDDHTPSESAAYEALEEAGVLGDTSVEPLGSFHYSKRRKSGEVVSCKVFVFAMEVVRQRRRWAEKSARETCWCSLADARARVTDPGLRRLITKFARHRAPGGATRSQLAGRRIRGGAAPA